jgi:8-oxo-dGTP pyrophosphatase MutT (NUDIX family)
MGSWQTKSSKVVYENPFMIVREDEVVKPNGKDGIYGYVESKSESVYVVPVDDEGNTYLVQQERYTIKQTTWECVAGRTDGEPVQTAAARELLEETGLKTNSITNIGEVRPANGMSTFKSTVFIAQDLKHISDELDPNDGILEVQKVPLKQIPEMILAGDITCAGSIAAFFMAIAYLEKEKTI